MKFILTIYKFDINSLIYIGSTWNYNNRLSKHKHDCYNENISDYNCDIYKYIRDNNIDWNDIIIEKIYMIELDEKNDLLKRQTEQKYINKYDSKNNGLNTKNAYITKEERKEQMKEWKQNNKEHLIDYYEKHKEHLKECSKEYYEEHKEEIKQKTKKYCEKHKEKIKQKKKDYYEKHKEEKKIKHKKYYEEHKEEIKLKNRLQYQHKKNVKICNDIVNELIDSLF